jgi:hypothetical protein
MTVTDSNATNCGAVGGGGGFLFSKRNNPLTVTGSRFVTVTQSGNEGGVRLYILEYNCVFVCVCVCLFVGGAFYLSGRPTTFTSCTFTGCKTNPGDGGIVVR